MISFAVSLQRTRAKVVHSENEGIGIDVHVALYRPKNQAILAMKRTYY